MANFKIFAVLLLTVQVQGARVKNIKQQPAEKECCCRTDSLADHLGATLPKSSDQEVTSVEITNKYIVGTTGAQEPVEIHEPSPASSTVIDVTARFNKHSMGEEGYNVRGTSFTFSLDPDMLQYQGNEQSFNSFKVLESGGDWVVYQDNCILKNKCDTMSWRSKEEMSKCEALVMNNVVAIMELDQDDSAVCCCSTTDLSSDSLGASINGNFVHQGDTFTIKEVKSFDVKRYTMDADGSTKHPIIGSEPSAASTTHVDVTAVFTSEAITELGGYDQYERTEVFELDPAMLKYKGKKARISQNSFKILQSGSEWSVYQNNCVKKTSCPTWSWRTKEADYHCDAATNIPIQELD